MQFYLHESAFAVAYIPLRLMTTCRMAFTPTPAALPQTEPNSGNSMEPSCRLPPLSSEERERETDALSPHAACFALSSCPVRRVLDGFVACAIVYAVRVPRIKHAGNFRFFHRRVPVVHSLPFSGHRHILVRPCSHAAANRHTQALRRLRVPGKAACPPGGRHAYPVEDVCV